MKPVFETPWLLVASFNIFYIIYMIVIADEGALLSEERR